MKLEINLTKGKFWALMAVGILLIGVLVYAAASGKPNPGHSTAEIEGLDTKLNNYITKDNLKVTIVEGDKGFSDTGTANCGDGLKLIGGGCKCADTDSGVEESYPDNGNKNWHCECDQAGADANKAAYAICLDLS